MDMLSWICPDCGCDCAPTDHECPDCADLVQAGMLALAKGVQEQLVSLPPPVEIPLGDRVPGGFRSIEPRAALAGPLRAIDPLPELPDLRPFLPGPIATARDRQPQTPPPPPILEALPEPGPLGPRRKIPGWLLSLIVATILSLGGAAIVRNMALETKSEAASPPAGQTSSALGRSIEVTGLRVLENVQHTLQVRYIIVNHSDILVSNLSLRIAVRSTASSDSAKPLFTVSALVTGLAAYESREIIADIEDQASHEIPEWDHLKPEVQVENQ
jgi:hypothetical protein